MAVLDELLVSLGFDYKPDDLKQFQKDLDGTVNTIKEFTKALIGSTVAAVGFVTATTNASDEQGKLSSEIGVAVGRINALQFANQRAGGTTDGLSSSLQQLSLRIGETARGVGSGLEAFGILGIQVTKANGELKDTDAILLEVSKKFETFSKSQQIELADKLGLRDSVRLLQLGQNGIEDLITEANRLGVVTEEDAKEAERFQDSLVDLWATVKQGARLLTKFLLPPMQELADTTTEWWKANREVIEQKLPQFIDRAVKGLKALLLASIAFIGLRLALTVVTLINVFNTLTRAVKLSTLALVLLPALVVGAIGAIALLAEDAMTFFEGGDSFVGDMLEKFPKWNFIIIQLAHSFNIIGNVTTSIFEGWKEIFNLFGTDIGANLKIVMAQLISDMKKLKNEFISGLLNKFPELRGDILNLVDVFNLLADITGLIFNGWKEIFKLLSFKGIGGDFKLFLIQLDKDFTQLQMDFIDNMVSGLDTILDNLKSKALGLFDDIKDSLSSVFSFDGVSTLFSGPNVIVSGFSKETNKASSNNNVVPIQRSSFSNTDIQNQSSSSSDNSITIQGGVEISVEGSKSPEETAIAIRKELEDLTEQTSIDMNSAVRI